MAEDQISVNKNANASAYSNPLFLSHNDNPGTILVTQIFDGNSFGAWKRAMSLALSVKNKLGFVTSRTKKPAEDDPTYDDWERCNSIVITWILNAMTKEISEGLIYYTIASAIWKQLHHMFEQSNLVMVFQLQKELNQIAQGTDSITTYYSRFKRIWDEFVAVDDLPDCSCTAGEAWIKRMERQQLVQFLFGLNDSYVQVRGNILHEKPTPTVVDAYATLIQEEQQREVNAPIKLNTEGMAMLANKNNSTGAKSFMSAETRRNLVCNYCKKKGHVKADCYKLNGFPENFKFNNPRRSFSFANAVEGITEISGHDYQQIMNFINTCKVKDTVISNSGQNSLNSTCDPLTTQVANEGSGFAACAGPSHQEALGTW